jgi:hypothetical protein
MGWQGRVEGGRRFKAYKPGRMPTGGHRRFNLGQERQYFLRRRRHQHPLQAFEAE